MLPFLVHKICAFYINGVLNCEGPTPGPKTTRNHSPEECYLHLYNLFAHTGCRTGMDKSSVNINSKYLGELFSFRYFQNLSVRKSSLLGDTDI